MILAAKSAASVSSPASSGVEATTGIVRRPWLVNAQGLRKSFGGDHLLQGVDLQLRAGEVVLLRGENGSGKTTLLNILTGHIRPDEGVLSYASNGAEKRFEFPRPWWKDLSWSHRFAPEVVAKWGLGRTWQDVRVFGSQSLRDNLAVAFPDQPGESPALVLLAPRRAGRRERDVLAGAARLLDSLGLCDRASAFADKISLGESKRLVIARAVAAGAKVLLLDEPLSGLDGRGVAMVLELLQKLQEQAVSLVVVEHELNQPLIRRLQTTDWVLRNRTLVADEPRPARRGTVVSVKPAVGRLPAWLRPLANTGEIVESPAELPLGANLTQIRFAARHRAEPVPGLVVEKLVVRRGLRAVVGIDEEGNETGLSFKVERGVLAVLQAPNGWGKSTLLAAIVGLVPHDGSIKVRGEVISNLPVWGRYRHGIRALASHRHVFPNLSEIEVLRLARGNRPPGAKAESWPKRCGEMSGGEKQILAWKATTGNLKGDEILILDEPFAGLDDARLNRCLPDLVPREDQTVLVLLPIRSEPEPTEGV